MVNLTENPLKMTKKLKNWFKITNFNLNVMQIKWFLTVKKLIIKKTLTKERLII